jgi:hypothetical protein
MKQASKICVNSMWGKHAERINLPSVDIFDMRNDRDQMDTLWMNILLGATKFEKATPLNENSIMYKTTTRAARPDLHKGYLPAALMIPAHGRSQLWNQMNQVSRKFCLLLHMLKYVLHIEDIYPSHVQTILYK